VAPGSTTPDNRSALERFLGLFTEVRAGEATTVLLLAANIFLILAAYYIIKPVREALILSVPHGAEIKSYASAGQALLLLGAVPLYAWIASRVPRRRLINGVTLFFAGVLVAFYIAVAAGAPVAVLFFLWIGIFNLMVPAQFWALANDVYTPEAGKRLFVIVAFGASAGAVFGSYIAGHLIAIFGVNQLILVSAGVLTASLLLTNIVDGREGAATSASGAPPEEPLGKSGAFELLLKKRYLLLIALLIFVLNWVNTVGEYILGRTVRDAALAAAGNGAATEAAVEAFIGGFYADFFTIVNIAGLLLQLFIVSRIFKYLGVRIALFILPVIALGGYIVAALFPILVAIRDVKIAENSTDYSLQNTVRQVLFLPTTREEKYKAKQAIDTFFQRGGDVMSALTVFVGSTILALGIRGFAIINIVLVLGWLVIAFLIAREHRRLVPDDEAGSAPKT
jgi:AAA family ATP:ADP antiporter